MATIKGDAGCCHVYGKAKGLGQRWRSCLCWDYSHGCCTRHDFGRSCSVPYTLTRQTKLTEFNPAIVVEEGALVVDAEYLNMVPRSQRWYTPSSLQTKVRLQQVVHPKLTLVAESGNNSLPNGCDKRSARNWGVRRVSEQQQEEILDQLTHRAIIEHEDNVLGRGCIGRRGWWWCQRCTR